MDALELLALGSVALLGLFATPALVDHLHERHRALHLSDADVPRDGPTDAA